MRGRRTITSGFALLACAGALALPGAAPARSRSVSAPPRSFASAALEGCAATGPQLERSATFSGEMTAVPGTSRMLMRIEVQERGSSEEAFRTISFPGLGVWLKATPGVHTFKNLQRVTDLSGPAEYRAQIRFRWLGTRGRQLRAQVLHTARCAQPALPATHTGSGSTGTGQSGSTLSAGGAATS
jgi:hypothetical protein